MAERTSELTASVDPGVAPVPAESTPTIVVDDLHVTYHVYEDRRPHLREIVGNGFKRPASRAIEAVQGVSIVARQGEAIGIVGTNGAGKSTLLQAMAGLLPPTRGTVHVRSQPVLLGVGAALQPSVSGRHNVLLGCLALGLTRAEVTARTEQIIEFAGLEDHIDLPLRTYSSGMRARLHFAIATAVEPEILFVDEALAVGDAVFKRRSRGRLKELRAKAGTVFLVSHSLREVQRTCSRVIWIHAGRVVEDGATKEVLESYRRFTADDSGD